MGDGSFQKVDLLGDLQMLRKQLSDLGGFREQGQRTNDLHAANTTGRQDQDHRGTLGQILDELQGLLLGIMFRSGLGLVELSKLSTFLASLLSIGVEFGGDRVGILDQDLLFPFLNRKLQKTLQVDQSVVQFERRDILDGRLGYPAFLTLN